MTDYAEPVDLDLDADNEDLPPSFVFQLGGRTWHCRHRDLVPWGPVERMLTALSSGNGAELEVGATLSTLLIPDEYDDFIAMVDDPNSPLTIGKVTTLLTTVVERVLARPTEPPTASHSGPSTTRPISVGGSSSAATRSTRSAGSRPKRSSTPRRRAS